MQPTATGTARYPRRGRLILLLIIPSLFSLVLSLAYADMAGQPGSMVGRTTSDSLIAIWAVAIVAIVLAVLATWSLVRTARAGSQPVKLVVGALATCLIAVAIVVPAGRAADAVTANSPRNDQVRLTLLGTIPVCQGQTGIEAASSYGGERHPMEIVLASADGSIADQQSDVTARAEQLGPLPDTLAAVQLVACIGQSSRVTLQTCGYTLGGTYIRYGYTLDVSIYAAKTGELLDRHAFTGAKPDACPETKSVGDDEDEGGQVSWDDARIWEYLTTWMSSPRPTG